MLSKLFKIYAYGWKSLIQKDIEPNDPALTGVSHSKIGTELLNQTAKDGIPLKCTDLKRAGGYYDSKERKIVLGNSAGFCTVAHETAHHNHTTSIKDKPNYGIVHKDVLLRRLIHEAEAYAIQALVVLEVYKNPNKDLTLKNRTEKSINKIQTIYPSFDQYLYEHQTEERKRELAANVFESYLTHDNSSFNYHLNSYFKFPSRLPRSFSVIANTAFVAGGAATINLGLSNWTDIFDFGIKGNSAIALFYTIMEANRSDEYKEQSSFSEVFESTDLGHVPKLEGNYLDTIRKTDMSQFDITLQKISYHVDNEINAFEKGVLDALLTKHPRVQNAAARYIHYMNLMPRI